MTLKLVWTRPTLYWEEDKKRLLENQINYLYYPCLRYMILENIKFPFSVMRKENSIVLFTSLFAAKVFSEKTPTHFKRSSYKIFVMGKKTFFFLKEKGFDPVLIKSHQASDFAHSLEGVLTGVETIFLPGAIKRAFDMKTFWEKRGFKSYNLDCYQTFEEIKNEQSCFLTESEKNIFLKDKNLVFSFFSPSAVRAFVSIFKEADLNSLFSARAIALGNTSYKACLPYFSHCHMAEDVSADSVINTFLTF